MKCKIFMGTWFEAQDAFNKWAKGKALGRDVIIHTTAVPFHEAHPEGRIYIVVYHPDDPFWDKPSEESVQPVQRKVPKSTGMERKEELIPEQFQCATCGASVKSTDYDFTDYNLYLSLYKATECEECARKYH